MLRTTGENRGFRRADLARKRDRLKQAIAVGQKSASITNSLLENAFVIRTTSFVSTTTVFWTMH